MNHIKKSMVNNRKLTTMHETGLALSYYDEVLGQEAKHGKYTDQRYSDLLVKASSDKLRRFFSVRRK